MGTAKEGKTTPGKMTNVDIDKLDTDNYAVWSVKMKAFLIIKDLWGAVSGQGEPKPEADGKALAQLALHVKDHHLPLLSKAETAAEAWQKLEAVYQAKSTARQLHLKRALNSLRKEPSEPLVQYVNRATDMRDQLLAAGHTVEDQELIMCILAGLPREFDTVVAVLEITDSKLELGGVLAKLLQAEQRLGSGERADNRALFTNKASKPQHRAGTGGSGNAKECWYCGKRGHLKAECQKKKRDEQRGHSWARWSPSGPNPSMGDSGHRNVAAMGATVVNWDLDWVLDSGASNHITGNKNLLSNIRAADHHTAVCFANGTIGETQAIGDALLETDRATIVLKDVLYIPTAAANLFSITTATGRGTKFNFGPTCCSIRQHGRDIGAAKRGPNGLYYIPSLREGATALAATPKPETAELWHRRFGHLGYHNLEALVREDMVDGIKVPERDFKAQKAAVCEPCILAKHHQAPFPTSKRESTEPLELLHMDLCGPMPVPSLGGSKYVATFLDDFSKLSIVRIITYKSETTTTVREVLHLLENQAKRRVQAIRTDNGREYVNTELTQYLKSRGILHQTTVPYTPEQNGTAERLNRTLMERARAMLSDAELPKELWAEAVNTANYIRCRSPAAKKLRTPWELFFGQKPDVSHMRTFGATAYSHIPEEKRQKLDNRSIRGVMELPEEPPDSDQPPAPQPQTTLRRSTRAPRPPSEWWKQPTAAGANASFSSKRDTANATSATLVEPDTYEEAMASEEAEQWQQAMDEEIASLMANRTWTLEELPPGLQAIPVKWVFKVKTAANGGAERYKARLVAKGYRQREGIDFDEVFAPVSKYATLRTLLAIVAAEDLELHQLDIKTAFLNGTIEEDIYLQQPPGYKEGPGNLACHLHRALYGLRQAPRQWHARLKQELEAFGFTESEADPGLFSYHNKEDTIHLLVYVDDILIAAQSLSSVEWAKSKVMTAFEARDLGEAQTYLGMLIERDRTRQSLKLSQQRMTTQLLSKYQMQDAKPKSVPLTASTKLTKDEGEPLDKHKYGYSQLIGSLMYLAVCTRPDIAQAVGALARYMTTPTTIHWAAALGVLRYLAGTRGQGICFGRGNSSDQLLGYCDSDYAGDLDTRRSTTGYVFILNGGAITWSSRRQQTVAASTTEAEYMAAAAATKEALWLRKLINDLQRTVSTITIRADNQGAVKLLKNPITSLRSKHIDVIYHFARERVARKEVVFEYVKTEHMLADFLTKPVAEGKHTFCRDGLGLTS